MDPIWAVLREQGRNLKWLARRMGYSHGYVRGVACGMDPVTAAFRQRAANALDLPVGVLFSSPRSGTNGRDAGTRAADTKLPSVADWIGEFPIPAKKTG